MRASGLVELSFKHLPVSDTFREQQLSPPSKVETCTGPSAGTLTFALQRDLDKLNCK